MYGNLTPFLKKLVNDCTIYNTLTCICPFGSIKTDWMAEFITLVLEDTYPLRSQVRSTQGSDPGLWVIHTAPCRWGDTLLDSTICPSCASFVLHDCSSLIVVFYCDKVSVRPVLIFPFVLLTVKRCQFGRQKMGSSCLPPYDA